MLLEEVTEEEQVLSPELGALEAGHEAAPEAAQGDPRPPLE